ncbi:MAG: hypothetical protein J2P56_05810 [Verrucomicrobia bacterium]|nr:hypothetical protein [Verrucomicrobiota bacterium]
MYEEDENETVKHRPSESRMPDNYSRLMGALDGLPDVEKTKERVIRHVPPFGIGGVETFLVQTFRQTGKDVIFLEHVSASGTTRLVLPSKVADAIADQRDQLTGKVRSKNSKRAAQARKDAGILPGFMKGKDRS